MAKNKHLKRKSNGAISYEAIESATRTWVKVFLAQAGATVLADEYRFSAGEVIEWMSLAMLTPDPALKGNLATTPEASEQLIAYYLKAWAYILKYTFDWDNKSKPDYDETLDEIPRWMKETLDATTIMLREKSEETQKVQEQLGELREQVVKATEER